MTNNTDKLFHDLTVKVAGKMAGECECTGLLYQFNADSPAYARAKQTCDKCAKLRAMAESCWHEIKTYFSGRHCSCGINICSFTASPHPCKTKNPTYTIQTIVAALKDLGLWERFERWLCLHYINNPEFKWERYGNILTTDPLLLQAAIAFLREVVDGH